MIIKLKAFAKVNLLLDLTSVLENGYHSIYTVMQSVGIYDTITVKEAPGSEIKLTCSDPNITVGDSNTCIKAAKAFFDHTGETVRGLDIHIDKVIPSKAGLAGGSADAAAVINALDKICGTGLSTNDKCQIGFRVGADVPFCIIGGTRLCMNIGEVTAHLPDLTDCSLVVVKPSQDVGTMQAYKDYDSTEWIRHPDNDGFLYAVTNGDFDTMCNKAANVFEQVVELKDRVRIKSVMRSHGAGISMMTGSGSAVYGLFKNKADAQRCYKELSGQFDDIFLTEPVSCGVKEVSADDQDN